MNISNVDLITGKIFPPKAMDEAAGRLNWWLLSHPPFLWILSSESPCSHLPSPLNLIAQL